MPRSVWSGALSFGLVSIPVKLYSASEEKTISFNQVHVADGGRVRHQRVCEACGEVVAFADLAKGYQAPDGRMAVLTSQDMAELPLKSLKTVDVVRFVPADEIDPGYFQKTYYLEADGIGAKPYVLLRDGLKRSNKIAIATVALRSRESLVALRTQGDLLVMHTMLWPDELRDGNFAAPPEGVTANDAEVAMAELLIDQLSGPFDPSSFTDHYREALDQLVAAKLDGAAPVEVSEVKPIGEVVDLVAALRASVEAAKARRAAS